MRDRNLEEIIKKKVRRAMSNVSFVRIEVLCGEFLGCCGSVYIGTWWESSSGLALLTLAILLEIKRGF